jgi:peroxiredoxin
VSVVTLSSKRSPWLRLYYRACFVLLTAALAAILWRLLPIPRPAPRPGLAIDEAAVREMLRRPLPDSAGGSLRLADVPDDYLVVFLFTPADCAAGLPELGALSRLGEESGDLGVVALMSFSNPEEAAQTREAFRLAVPILQDPDGAVLASLHPPRTPWKVVVRQSDGKVLFEDPPNIAEGARAAFLERLQKLGA